MSENMGPLAMFDETKRAYMAAICKIPELERERDRLIAELAKLKAEREPRDNGDGTVTAWKPVTFFKSLDVSEVRAPKKGELCAGYCGASSANANSDFEPGTVRLILRPAPKPPEPVTWEAPASLPDGEMRYEAKRSLWLFYPSKHDSRVQSGPWEYQWDVSYRDWTDPPKPGRYEVVNGVGTLIQEAGNE